MGWAESFAGRECRICGRRAGLFVIIRCRWTPPHSGNKWTNPRPGSWAYYPYARCYDRAACEARRSKKAERSRVRGGVLVLAEPKAPDAPLGVCRWCGEELTGENASRRNYCYPEREGRNCRDEWDRSRTWDARTAIQRRGDPACVDCGSEHWDWEADHEVPLEDGGEHSLENLVRRCSGCHRRKTSRENAERARRRRGEPADQLAMG